MTGSSLVDSSFPLEYSNDMEIITCLPENITLCGHLVLCFDENKKKEERVEKFISLPVLKTKIPSFILEKITDFLLINDSEIDYEFQNFNVTTMDQYISKKTDYVNYSSFRVAY